MIFSLPSHFLLNRRGADQHLLKHFNSSIKHKQSIKSSSQIYVIQQNLLNWVSEPKRSNTLKKLSQIELKNLSQDFN